MRSKKSAKKRQPVKPVVVVAEHFGADDERLARALMLSHLSAIYIHNQLPRLSAPVSYTHLDVYKRQENREHAGRSPRRNTVRAGR